MPNKQSSSSASSSIVAIRTDFTVTPFHVFKLPLIEGKAHVNFTTGEELGTYAVRVVVVDTAHNALGSAEVISLAIAFASVLAVHLHVDAHCIPAARLNKSCDSRLCLCRRMLLKLSTVVTVC